MSTLGTETEVHEPVAELAADSCSSADLELCPEPPQAADIETTMAEMKLQLRSAADRLRLANLQLSVLQNAVDDLWRRK